MPAKDRIKTILGRRPLLPAALRTAALRGRGVTLLVHRLAAGGPQPHEVVPSVPVARFRRQLQVLRTLGEIVPAAELAQHPAGRTTPRFALTFDDDYGSQRLASEILADMGMPGTFFLSGRALHGLGAYWWEVLESDIARDGLDVTARRLGRPGVRSVAELAASCEGTEVADGLAQRADEIHPHHLAVEDIAAIAATPGMTVGFHTVDHPLLPALGPEALRDALTRGRRELEEVVGAPVDLMAYPHGKASDEVVRQTAAAGFRLAWTGQMQPVTRASERLTLGRWEPGDLPADLVAAHTVVRLHRRQPPAPRAG